MGCERESCVGRADLDGRPLTQLSLGRFRFSPDPEIGCLVARLPKSRVRVSPRCPYGWYAILCRPADYQSRGRQSIPTDSKHRQLAVPHDVLRNATQKQMRQSRAAVGSHYDHLALQFQSRVHNHGTW
jgi:hypothetical protein